MPHTFYTIPLDASTFFFPTYFPRPFAGVLSSEAYVFRINELNDQISFSIHHIPSRRTLVFVSTLFLFFVPLISLLLILLAPISVSIPIVVVLCLIFLMFSLVVNFRIPKKRKQNLEMIMSLVGSALNQWNREDNQSKKLVWHVLPGNSEVFQDFRDSNGQRMIPKPPLGIQAVIYAPLSFTAPNQAFSATVNMAPPHLEITLDDVDTLTLCEEKQVSDQT